MARLIHEEGEAKLKRAEQMIQKLERSTVIDRAAVTELAKMTYWLLDRWCREHDNGGGHGKKKVLPRESSEELGMPVL